MTTGSVDFGAVSLMGNGNCRRQILIRLSPNRVGYAASIGQS